MNSPQKLLVLYTGGTIGMQMSEAGLAPATGGRPPKLWRWEE